MTMMIVVYDTREMWFVPTYGRSILERLVTHCTWKFHVEHIRKDVCHRNGDKKFHPTREMVFESAKCAKLDDTQLNGEKQMQWWAN